MATEVPGQYYLRVLDDMFSKQECKDLLARAEKTGWHKPGTGGTYMRSIIIDQALAKELHNRIKEHIPDTYKADYFNKDGTYIRSRRYRLICINDHFRFSKYYKGGRFPIHYDGKNIDSEGRESVFTLNIFLNDNFEGGETDFFDYHTVKLRYSVEPKPGRGALFYADQLHQGNKVTKPFKYLIRTDVMGYEIDEEGKVIDNSF